MARIMRGQPRYDPAALAAYQPPEAMLALPVRPIAAGGENKTFPLSALPNGSGRLVQNLALRYGAYQTRDGTSVIGGIAANKLVAAIEVVTSDGQTHLTRYDTGAVQVFVAGDWADTSGDTWSCSYTSPFAFTGWVDTVLFSSGGSLFSMDFSVGFPKTIVADAPTGIKHLATFAGRIVASLANQIQWTVRDDYTDWSGLGSGYEDIRSAPGGRPDSQTAVVPVSDEVAYVVRSNSFWQMSQTGNFDSPFALSLIWSGAGSKWPQTVAQIPQGLICLGTGQIWMLTAGQGLQDIGQAIASDLLIADGSLQQAVGMYDPKWNEYRLTLPSPGSGSTKVLRFNLSTQIWTEDLYPFPIRNMAPTLFAQNISIDELLGSIDDLQGTIDSLSIGARQSNVVYAMGDNGRYVVQDRAANNNLPMRDVNLAGAAAASGFRVETGDAVLNDPMRRKECIQLQMSYQAEAEFTATFEYSYDGGQTWNFLSSQTLPAANRPTWISVDRSLERESIQFAVSTDATPTVRLIDLVAFMREAGMVQDAR